MIKSRMTFATRHAFLPFLYLIPFSPVLATVSAFSCVLMCSVCVAMHQSKALAKSRYSC